MVEWHRDAGQQVTATAVSARITVDSRADALRITNVGLNTAHVRVQAGLPVAATSDLAIRSNSEVTVAKIIGVDSVAYISPLGTVLHIHTGARRPYQHVT